SGPRNCAQLAGPGAPAPPRCALSDPEAVEGIVLMRKKANPSEVLAHLREKIAHLNADVLPKGVRVNPFYDRPDLVHRTLPPLAHNLPLPPTLLFLILL